MLVFESQYPMNLERERERGEHTYVKKKKRSVSKYTGPETYIYEENSQSRRRPSLSAKNHITGKPSKGLGTCYTLPFLTKYTHLQPYTRSHLLFQPGVIITVPVSSDSQNRQRCWGANGTTDTSAPPPAARNQITPAGVWRWAGEQVAGRRRRRKKVVVVVCRCGPRSWCDLL